MNIARYVSSRNLLAIGIAICLMHPGRLADGQDDLAIVHRVPKQPLLAATARLAEAMEFAGSPLDEATRAAILLARELDTPADVSRAIQSTLDPLCLASVHINAESRVKVAEGPVKKQLMQQGWRAFLVKVHNEAGITAELVADSPNAAPVYQQGRGARQQPRTDEDLVDPSETEDRWLDLSMLNRAPMKKQLSGLNLEYRIVMLGSRDAGKREANIAFNVGQGTQDIGFRNSVPILFDCQRAVDVQLGISDVDGKPTTASLLITDDRGRVYPNPAKRLAPDFFFHHQVYRADGESVLLPPGEYNVSVTRGPEYVPIRRRLQIPETAQHRESFQLKRWIHLAKRRWYSGDHHVHAAGCAHYDSPTEGVGPEDMMRHLLGEDVNVGFDVAALLKESPTDETERIRKLRLDEKPYWHLERCRIGDSRRVPVEVIVNGRVAATREIVADGSLTSHSIPVPIDASSWIALRILPSVHTNPVFVHVAGEPIRASKKSAQWCIDAVETCWNSKRGQIRESERAEAKAAYDRAAERYRTILTESKQ